MWNTFKYTLKSLMRERHIVFWVMLFPLVLATLFNAMFSGLEKEAFQLKPIPCVIVDDGNLQASPAFAQTIEDLSQGSGDHLIDSSYVDSLTEARKALDEGSAVGYIVLDAGGKPSLTISPVTDTQSLSAVDRTILADIVNGYVRSSATFASIAASNPAALRDPALLEKILDGEDHTQQISVTYNASAQSVRYFYALLGFSTLMAAMIGLRAITRTQPNLSALGARRSVGATSRGRTLGGALLASWVLAFCALMVGFAYMRVVLGVSFGDRDAECVIAIAMGSLTATAIGALIGAIPKLPEGAKGGMLTGLTCVLSLFAGLYGTPSLKFADQVSRSCPWLAGLNPAKQISDLFYSLYFYPSLDPFFEHLLILGALTAVFALIAGVLMRRQRYASL